MKKRNEITQIYTQLAIGLFTLFFSFHHFVSLNFTYLIITISGILSTVLSGIMYKQILTHKLTTIFKAGTLSLLLVGVLLLRFSEMEMNLFILGLYYLSFGVFSRRNITLLFTVVIALLMLLPAFEFTKEMILMIITFPVLILKFKRDMGIEKKLKQGQQLSQIKLLKKLIGQLSHDINNRLTKIMFAVTVNESTSDDIIVDETTQIGSSLRDVDSMFTQLEGTTLSPIKVNDLILEVCEVYKSKADPLVNLSLDIIFHPNLEILADYDQIKTVILNLLKNAEDSIIKAATLGSIRVVCEVQGQRLIIAVSDNGVPISKENELKIFDLFFSTKKVGQGLGLGLPVSKLICSLHDGSLSMQQYKRDTRFLINLPIFKK